MSLSAAHESKTVRRSCHSCHNRKARFRYRGAVRADRDHVLCFQCFRAERERWRARLLAAVPARPLTQRRIAHRRAMLAHLASVAEGGLR